MAKLSATILFHFIDACQGLPPDLAIEQCLKRMRTSEDLMKWARDVTGDPAVELISVDGKQGDR